MTNPAAVMQFKTLTLERAAVAARHALSAQMAHDLSGEWVADYMADTLVCQLRTYVHRERLLRDDQSARFTRSTTVEAPAARMLWPLALVVILTCALGAVTATLAPFVIAAAIALAGIVALAANPPRTIEATVSGTVTIPVTSYASYPDNATALPESYGSIVAIQEAGSPYWEWDR